ncbi:argininosuccinate synthase domain-containing protein [Campylobacter sputorum]|uniref:argininosuccinate synthase domain-containing protein n=1 Tax=Campylobacter sputorum TaxID=206 RepID=UPI00053BFD40|nr:argininosuccinate synthase domain-containing protein [Campylobacter sputorum]
MRALALFSGGLDSMLAIKLITLQGLEVTALYMDNGFGATSEHFKILRHRAASVGADFEVIDMQERYLQDVLFNPKFGYGKWFNPCIDCHGYMFKTALNLLNKFSANFVISGEVLGQRPMSQRREAMNSVARLSGDEENLILRPLCAKLLNPTKPEIMGWVDREKLLDISGRGRSIQKELVKKFNIKEYASPAGGCLLTLENFANKIKDMQDYNEKIEVNDIAILRYGRHLRLEDGAKMVVGRDEKENAILKSLNNIKFKNIDITPNIGAYSLISKNASQKDKYLASKIAITYAKTDPNLFYDVFIENEKFNISPFENKNLISRYFIK